MQDNCTRHVAHLGFLDFKFSVTDRLCFSSASSMTFGECIVPIPWALNTRKKRTKWLGLATCFWFCAALVIIKLSCKVGSNKIYLQTHLNVLPGVSLTARVHAAVRKSMDGMDGMDGKQNEY